MVSAWGPTVASTERFARSSAGERREPIARTIATTTTCANDASSAKKRVTTSVSTVGSNATGPKARRNPSGDDRALQPVEGEPAERDREPVGHEPEQED